MIMQMLLEGWFLVIISQDCSAQLNSRKFLVSASKGKRQGRSPSMQSNTERRQGFALFGKCSCLRWWNWSFVLQPFTQSHPDSSLGEHCLQHICPAQTWSYLLSKEFDLTHCMVHPELRQSVV